MLPITAPIETMEYAAMLIACTNAACCSVGKPPILPDTDEPAKQVDELRGLLQCVHSLARDPAQPTDPEFAQVFATAQSWATQPANVKAFPHLCALLTGTQPDPGYRVWQDLLIRLLESPTYRAVVCRRARPYRDYFLCKGGEHTPKERMLAVLQCALPAAQRSVIGRAAQMRQRCLDNPKERKTWLYRALHEIGSNIAREIRAEVGLAKSGRTQQQNAIRARVRGAVEALPEPYRTVVHRHLNGESFDQIAGTELPNEVGAPTRARVEELFNEARKQLRVLLHARA